MTQPDLFTQPVRVVVPPSDVDRLLTALAGRGWRTAKDLRLEGWTERQLRATAHESGGRVLGGQRGYALTREASDDEADRVERFLLSQARSMQQRAVDIRKARNRRGVA